MREGRRVGPGLRSELRERRVLLQHAGAQQLHPRRLLGPELAQAQLPSVGDAHEQARGAIARPRAPVIELQSSRVHEVHEQRQATGHLHDQVLAPAAHSVDVPALQLAERGIDRLERVDAGRKRRLDQRAPQRMIEQARGDLDLGQLGHGLPL